jgi:hypothetical protein
MHRMNSSLWNRLRNKNSRRTTASRRPDRRALRPSIEGMEERQLLSVTSNLVNGQLQVFSGNGDTIALDHAGSFTFVNGSSFADSAITKDIAINAGSFFGGGFNTVNIRATVKPVTVNSPGRIDFLNVGGKAGLGMQGILASVSLKGFNEGAKLTFDDSANTFSGRNATLTEVPFTATLSGLAPAPITFLDTGFTDLNINGGSAGNTLNVFDTPHQGFFHFTHTHLNSGFGNDTVNVFGSSSTGLDIHGQSGLDKVNLGAGGSVQGLLSGADIDNTLGFTALTVDDSNDTVGRNVTMDVFADGGAQIVGLDPSGGGPFGIFYVVKDVSSVTVNGGSGGNTFTINDTAFNNFPLITTINSGTGIDTVNVRGTTGKLTINGQNGSDRVTIGSSDLGTKTIHGNVFVTNTVSRSALEVTDAPGTVGHNNVVLDHVLGPREFGILGNITGLAPATIQYVANDVNAVRLTGSTKDDTFFVHSTPNSGIPVSVFGRDGNDLAVVGSAAGSLDTILGEVGFIGGFGFDTLVVNDQGAPVGHTYTDSGSRITRSGGGTPTVVIDYISVESKLINVNAVIGSAPQAENLKLTKSIKAGQSATLTGRLVDADAADTLTLTVDWGDGTGPQQSQPDRKPFALKHKYASPGTYTVHVTWTDSTGLSNSKDLQVSVAPKLAKPGLAHAVKAHHGPRR